MQAAPATTGGAVLKLIVYAGIAVGGLTIFPAALYLFGVLVAAAIGTFAAAAVANAMTLRIFERAKLVDAGLGWTAGSARNLWLGLAGGIGAAAVALGGPLLARVAYFAPAPEQQANAGSALFVLTILLFGAVGEELLLRGYGFQLLLARIGLLPAVLSTSIVFALLHINNVNASTIGLVNTAGFGVVLGYAMARAGDLWLPIGIHVGWNWMLPLAGVNLSGFTMGVTGYSLRWRVSDLWSGGAYGIEASVLTSGVILALLWYVHKAPVARHTPVLLRPQSEA